LAATRIALEIEEIESADRASLGTTPKREQPHVEEVEVLQRTDEKIEKLGEIQEIESPKRLFLKAARKAKETHENGVDIAKNAAENAAEKAEEREREREFAVAAIKLFDEILGNIPDPKKKNRWDKLKRPSENFTSVLTVVFPIGAAFICLCVAMMLYIRIVGIISLSFISVLIVGLSSIGFSN
jgi:hypothetical protein